MNTCDKLPLYFYNEMNEHEKKNFENHVQNCKECEDSIKVFAAVKNSAQLTSAPLQTINAIFEKTARKKSFSFADYFKTWKVTAAFAAGLLIGVFAFSLKDFSHKSGNVYHTDVSFEEIDDINYELDEIENYYFIV